MVHITDLRANFHSSLKQDLVNGLRGNGDGPAELIVTPEDRDDGDSLPHTRSIPTMVLYSDKGLSIYEEITQLEAYYPFAAELEILEKYGDEIASRMFGDSDSEVLTDAHLREGKDGNGGGGGPKDHEPSVAANGAAKKEKWGDQAVGTNNRGVNGGLNAARGKVGLAVELGSGSLEKTRHLLRSMSKLLKSSDSGGEAPFTSIKYKALDLEHASLLSTLSKLVEQEADFVTSSDDGTPRVVASGIAATYDEGLAHLKSHSPSDGGSRSNNGYLPPNGTNAPPSTIKALLWLGSSIGNFSRSDAAAFVKNIAENVLDVGDSFLIGIDNCNDGAMVANGYDDPQGVTRRFIFEGVEVGGRTLHGDVGGDGGMRAKNFDYVSRWNARVGRHEAYLCCKVDNLVIPVPEREGQPAHDVVLKKDELLAIEVSYKYTQAEARVVFDVAGLRLVQQWTDSRQLHSLYLLEKTPFFFPSSAALLKTPSPIAANPYGVPSIAEWETMWKCWDAMTLELIPRDLLATKPIPLRHIILFYLGHIPAFLDIQLSKYFDEPHTEPASFAEIFERGIDPSVEDPTKITHSHSTVPTNKGDWPKVEVILEYQGRVRERLLKVYAEHGGKMSRRLARVLVVVFEHEAMHMETLVYIALQASSSLLPISGWRAPDFGSLSRSWDRSIKAQGISRQAVLDFGAKKSALGHDDDDRKDDDEAYDEKHEFGWDVETPRREVEVGAFRIDALPISNVEYLHYLSTLSAPSDDLFPSSWASTSEFKVYDAASIKVKTLYGEVPFGYAKHWPVTGSATQLESFAKAKGGRLPTQAELSVFLAQNPVDSPSSNIGFAHLHPVPPTLPQVQRDGSVGLASDGGVWQWTSTILEAHDGYSPSILYPGYSSDFHDGKHQIILGGSFVTPPRLARSSFVNWYQGAYPFVLAGARVAYDAE